MFLISTYIRLFSKIDSTTRVKVRTQMSDECSICLECINVSTTGRVEMSCSHTFHLKCIGQWLNKNSSCPLCRTKPSELETLLTPVPPVVYGIGSRRLIEMTNSHTDRIREYSIRFTTHSDSSESLLVVNSEHQEIGADPVGPLPADTDGIPGRDIRLVSQQTGMTDEQCLDALRRNNGDIVNSIMELVNEQ